MKKSIFFIALACLLFSCNNSVSDESATKMADSTRMVDSMSNYQIDQMDKMESKAKPDSLAKKMRKGEAMYPVSEEAAQYKQDTTGRRPRERRPRE